MTRVLPLTLRQGWPGWGSDTPKVELKVMALSNEQFYEDVDLLPMPLSVFVELYGTKLPQVVTVNESIYGVCSEALSEGQHLQVYFKKESKVVDVSLSSRNCVVPVSSQLKASVLYNPHNNLEKAKEGYYFATVADLIKAVPPPSVVSVGKKWTSSKDSTLSLQKGQILIVNGVDSFNQKGRKLNCIDIDSNTLLCLEETCKGYFTTQPSLIAINLQLLVKHLQLPIQVMFFHYNDTKSNKLFQNETGNITKEHVLQSVIVAPTFTERNQYDDVPGKIFEIVVSVPINVTVKQISEEDRIKLNIGAQRLAKILNPSLVTEVVLNISPTVNSFQEEVLKFIPENEWRNDVQKINIGEYEVFNELFIQRESQTCEDLTDLRDIHLSPQYELPLPLVRPPTKNKIPLYVPAFPSGDTNIPPPIPPKPKRAEKTIVHTSDNCYTDSIFSKTNENTSLKKVSSENELLLTELSELRKSNVQLTARLHELESTITGKKESKVIKNKLNIWHADKYNTFCI